LEGRKHLPVHLIITRMNFTIMTILMMTGFITGEMPKEPLGIGEKMRGMKKFMKEGPEIV
jgi:hypothetical protein